MIYLTNAHPRVDLLVTSEEGCPELLIEVRAVREPTPALLAAVHAQLKAMEPACFGLLVTTRRFWLWGPGAATPTYEGDTAELLERYIHLEKVPLKMLDEPALSSVVYSWLGSIIFKPADVLLTMSGQRWLVDTGLHPRIYRGYIQWEAAVA